MPGKECQPAARHLPIGPEGNDIGTRAQNRVVVVRQDGIGTDFDGKDGGKMPQPLDQPCFAVGKISLGQWVEAIEERPPDAPAEAVIHPFLPFLDIFAARQSHGSPLLNAI
jgi:hypothetical protein